jgi:hypothetical protein
MVAVLTFVILVIVVLGITLVVHVFRDEITEGLRRQRMATEVARATSRLRRLEHDATRHMNDLTNPYIDVEGEER